MDNLTHTIIATAIGTSILADKPVHKHTIRIALVSAFIAFMPDLDFVLRFKSHTLYALEHRGFTHSILGMVVLIPLGAYIARHFLCKAFDVSWGLAFKYSFAIWFFGHIVPDFFTIYGVQILYPFSNMHYDYALTFIIDIMFWIFGVAYLIVFFKIPTLSLRLSNMFLGFLILTYITYAGIRFDVVNDFQQKHPTVHNIKYTPIMHPFVAYNVFGDSDKGYVQRVDSNIKTLPIFGKLIYKDTYPYMPKNLIQNALPNNGVYSNTSKYLFERYQLFALALVCEAVPSGANCSSLKYKYPSVGVYQRETKVLDRHIPFKQ